MSAASPRWLRLTRAGDVITGYDSADGTQLDQDRHRHPARAGADGAGRAVRHVPAVGGDGLGSHQRIRHRGGATDATATFDRVGLRGGWPGSAWTGTTVHGGPDSPYVTGHEARYGQAGGAFTVTGSGDMRRRTRHGRRSPLMLLLAGLFIALVALMVVGAHVHHRRVPAGPDPRHARRQPAARPGSWRPRPSSSALSPSSPGWPAPRSRS